MRNFLGRPLAMVAAVAVLGWVLYPSPASAAQATRELAAGPPRSAPCQAVTGSTVCFEINGDRFWVNDTASDRASADAEWLNYTPGGTPRDSGLCINSSGVSGGWKSCDYNFAEGNTIRWRACVTDYSRNKVIRCGTFRTNAA
jgi:hypothetical protein